MVPLPQATKPAQLPVASLPVFLLSSLPLNTQPVMVPEPVTTATMPPWVPSPAVELLMVTLLRQSVMVAVPCTMPTSPAAYLPSVLMVPVAVQPLTVSVPPLPAWLTRAAG